MKSQGMPGAARTDDPRPRWQNTAGFSDPDFKEEMTAPGGRVCIDFLSSDAKEVYRRAFATARQLLGEGVSYGNTRWEVVDRSGLALPGSEDGFRVAEVQEAAVRDALIEMSPSSKQ